MLYTSRLVWKVQNSWNARRWLAEAGGWLPSSASWHSLPLLQWGGKLPQGQRTGCWALPDYSPASTTLLQRLGCALVAGQILHAPEVRRLFPHLGGGSVSVDFLSCFAFDRGDPCPRHRVETRLPFGTQPHVSLSCGCMRLYLLSVKEGELALTCG